jgi:hypothetical protein
MPKQAVILAGCRSFSLTPSGKITDTEIRAVVGDLGHVLFAGGRASMGKLLSDSGYTVDAVREAFLYVERRTGWKISDLTRSAPTKPIGQG